MQSAFAFGGDWTQEKLESLKGYLPAYTTALKNQKFQLLYIDAFAGAGYRTEKSPTEPTALSFPEFAEQDVERFLIGSARIALQTRPAFDQYIFIEKDARRFEGLVSLKSEFSEVADRILPVNGEANRELVELCQTTQWIRQGVRAVLFLDPFGMQVDWSTVEEVALTHAIDVWLLFPLGMAINRLLRRDGNISGAVRVRLDSIFGTDTWYDTFYEKRKADTLFGPAEEVVKVGDFDRIEQFFIQRLESVFSGVAQNPQRLYNSKGVPLYTLFFAVGNPKGKPIALRMAEHILGKRGRRG